MGKSKKNQHLREEMLTAIEQSKQTTLGSFPDMPQKESARADESEQKKQIIITEIGTVTKEDELALEVRFRLLPSKTAFSKITSDLYFDEQKLNSACISIPQSPLATNDFELNPVLDMKGIAAGPHIIRVEMCELWSSGEKLTHASKEVAVNYVPINREDRLIKIPIVKSIAGTDLTVVLNSDKNIYREIEEIMKKESISKRDEW
jgi:hypothetical protein